MTAAAGTPRHHEGRVAIVTGASRGIGREVAIQLGREGATVVVAAKTVDPHPTLEGTLGETVAAIEAVGGRAKAVQVDVRDAEQIRAMVDGTVADFGRLDILFNNAGAIKLQRVEDTTAKAFDLMYQVNVRAATLASAYAIPHMRAGGYGHILMFSPELHTEPSPNMAPYMVTKLGMTRVAMSIAVEHAGDNIAANAIWPVTMIDTAAVRNNGLGDPSQWRTPQIIVDAVSHILAQAPADFSGRTVTDEQVLAEAGITDLDHYWVLGAPPEQVMSIAGPDGIMH